MVNEMSIKKKVRTLKEYKEDRLSLSEREQINFETSVMSRAIEARKKKGLTQQELADMLGMKQPAIARFENFDTVPQIDTIFNVLCPLGYTLKVVPIKESELATAK